MCKTENRVVWIDMCRILAICLMMLYHLCGKGMWWASVKQYQISYFSVEYRILIFFHMISRICIPVILMISGMFMLEPRKEDSIRHLYVHNILRIFLSLMVWNAVYTLHQAVRDGYDGKELIKAWKAYFIETHYHLIFLYSLIGIYMLVPVLRILAQYADRQIWNYMLIFCMTGICIFPTLGLFDVPVYKCILNYIIKFFPVFISASSGIGYIGYCMLGYYLKKYDISVGKIRFVTAMAVIAGIVEVIGKPYESEKIASLGYYDMGTIFASIATVLWMKQIFGNPSARITKFLERKKNVIFALSKWSFGAYLVHDFILQYLIAPKSYLLVKYPLLLLAVYELVVVMGSFGVSAVLNRIPFVQKYFV